MNGTNFVECLEMLLGDPDDVDGIEDQFDGRQVGVEGKRLQSHVEQLGGLGRKYIENLHMGQVRLPDEIRVFEPALYQVCANTVAVVGNCGMGQCCGIADIGCR